jgi:transposase
MQGRATKEDVMTSTQVFVGIDISKAQLDLALRPEGQFSAPNNEAGFAHVLESLSAVHPTLVVLEATGGLEIPLTGVLAAAGVPVVVVNPRQVRDFAKATWRLAKTDALDAQTLAHFAEVMRPEPRPLPDEQAHALAAILARRRQLVEMLTAEKNRLGTARKPARRGQGEEGRADSLYAEAADRSECDAETSNFMARGIGSVCLTAKTVAAPSCLATVQVRSRRHADRREGADLWGG